MNALCFQGQGMFPDDPANGEAWMTDSLVDCPSDAEIGIYSLPSQFLSGHVISWSIEIASCSSSPDSLKASGWNIRGWGWTALASSHRALWTQIDGPGKKPSSSSVLNFIPYSRQRWKHKRGQWGTSFWQASLRSRAQGLEWNAWDVSHGLPLVGIIL